MGRSERVLLLTLFFALPLACATVTGLSDDYKFDLEAGPGTNSDGATNDGTTADGSSDAPSDTALPFDGGKCTAIERTTANTEMTAENGSKVPTICRACLAASCCDSVHSCTLNNVCKNAMGCVFGCQDKTQQNEKRQCLQGCDENAFNANLGSCAQQQCQSQCALK